ncbi:MAG TPA: HEAT repeat domain-containing protein, partial [Anaerolineae bacterium]|nr:HEAT repeat domain-containing protein [Anaerolineae bacterium]
MFESMEQALALLNDPQADSLQRVDAVRYLGDLGIEEAIQALVTLLEDDDYGVRWAAADALAKLGEKAAPAVLRKLLDPQTSSRAFEMAAHVFKNNGDILVRSKSEALVKALEADHTIEA